MIVTREEYIVHVRRYGVESVITEGVHIQACQWLDAQGRIIASSLYERFFCDVPCSVIYDITPIF